MRTASGSLRLRAGQKIDIYIAQGNIYLFSVLKSGRVRYLHGGWRPLGPFQSMTHV